MNNPVGCGFDPSRVWSGVLITSQGKRVLGSTWTRHNMREMCVSWPKDGPIKPLESTMQSACPVTEIGDNGELISYGQWLGLWIL